MSRQAKMSFSSLLLNMLHLPVIDRLKRPRKTFGEEAVELFSEDSELLEDPEDRREDFTIGSSAVS